MNLNKEETHMSDIEKFDPAKLMQGVRDRVKATFVSLIPDDQWEQMIKTECDKFFQITERDWRGDRPCISDFQMVVNSALREITEIKVKEELKKYESTIWDGSNIKINDELKKLLIESAPELFAKIMGSRVQEVINNMQQSRY